MVKRCQNSVTVRDMRSTTNHAYACGKQRARRSPKTINPQRHNRVLSVASRNTSTHAGTKACPKKMHRRKNVRPAAANNTFRKPACPLVFYTAPRLAAACCSISHNHHHNWICTCVPLSPHKAMRRVNSHSIATLVPTSSQRTTDKQARRHFAWLRDTFVQTTAHTHQASHTQSATLRWSDTHAQSSLLAAASPLHTSAPSSPPHT